MPFFVVEEIKGGRRIRVAVAVFECNYSWKCALCVYPHGGDDDF